MARTSSPTVAHHYCRDEESRGIIPGTRRAVPDDRAEDRPSPTAESDIPILSPSLEGSVVSARSARPADQVAAADIPWTVLATKRRVTVVEKPKRAVARGEEDHPGDDEGAAAHPVGEEPHRDGEEKEHGCIDPKMTPEDRLVDPEPGAYSGKTGMRRP